MTTPSDAGANPYPADDVAALGKARRSVEVNLRPLKTTKGIDVRRCQTVAGTKTERWAFPPADNRIPAASRFYAIRDAIRYQTDPAPNSRPLRPSREYRRPRRARGSTHYVEASRGGIGMGRP